MQWLLLLFEEGQGFMSQGCGASVVCAFKVPASSIAAKHHCTRGSHDDTGVLVCCLVYKK